MFVKDKVALQYVPNKLFDDKKPVQLLKKTEDSLGLLATYRKYFRGGRVD
jgi:hypothetical protein